MAALILGLAAAALAGRDRRPPHPLHGDHRLARRHHHRPGPGGRPACPASPARAPPSPPACFLGLDRQAAARFSFLLATPIVAGAGVKKVYDALKAGLSAGDQAAFALGLAAAAISGYLCISFLLRYLQRNSTAALCLLPGGPGCRRRRGRHHPLGALPTRARTQCLWGPRPARDLTPRSRELPPRRPPGPRAPRPRVSTSGGQKRMVFSPQPRMIRPRR